jgi:hypothetical protein
MLNLVMATTISITSNKCDAISQTPEIQTFDLSVAWLFYVIFRFNM